MERLPRGIYSPKFREQAVCLHEVDGLTIPEVAKRLSLPGGTLKNWVYASRQGKLGEVDKNQKPLTELEMELARVKREPALLLVLDGVQDPHNLGACLRVADAMGAHAVVVPKDRAAGLNATVRKVACGAAETVPFVSVTNLARSLREIKEAGIWVVGAAGEAEGDLFSAKLDGPVAWVLGAEGEGLRRLTRETCDLLVRIPMFGSVESLNVSVASGICLYETRRQRVASK